MFKIIKNKIEMVEGDFGIELPITINLEDDEIIGTNNNFRISIFKDINGELLIQKDYTLNEKNTFNFSLTKIESEKLKVGTYKYDLDWYYNQSFLNNIIAKENFIVKEKAGVILESNDNTT